MFFKFPRTPLLISQSTQNLANDRVLSSSDTQTFLSNNISVEEKIDGANLGISFSDDGQIQLQNRGHYLMPPLEGQWKPLEKWVQLHQDELFDTLSIQYILYGEWCYAKHSIYYDRLPDWFIAFDIFDIEKQRFFSVKRRNSVLKSTDVKVVPQLSNGNYSLMDLQNKLVDLKSEYGSALCEGLYLRHDEEDWLVERAKLVRKNFTQAIDEHWSKQQMVKNQLAYFE